MNLFCKNGIKYWLLLLTVTTFTTGCSTTYVHNMLAEKIILDKSDFSEAWHHPKINADCRVQINCVAKCPGYRNLLLATDKIEYPLRDILYEFCVSMRDKALQPDNRGSSFVLEIDVQQAQMQIEKNWHFIDPDTFTSKFRIKVIARMFDPQHNRLLLKDFLVSKEEEFVVENENDYDLKSSNVIYESCKEITKQIFKEISENKTIIRELKKFD